MDIIAHAQAKRESLKAEIDRIEAFLATAFELEHEIAAAPRHDARTNAQKADAPVHKRTVAASGTGSATVKAVVAILEERGAQSTKELLPLVRAKGIEVGGKEALATLAARISGKGRFRTEGGKWHLIEASGASASGGEAAADPTKETAASLFHSDQGERRDAAALAE